MCAASGWDFNVDAQDHVLVLNRRKLTDHELEAGRQAPPVIEFDRDGNVVNSWGDPNLLPKLLYGCSFDRDGNLWIGGSWDGMVQKYTHDGSKLLLQIGSKDVYAGIANASYSGIPNVVRPIAGTKSVLRELTQ